MKFDWTTTNDNRCCGFSKFAAAISARTMHDSAKTTYFSHKKLWWSTCFFVDLNAQNRMNFDSKWTRVLTRVLSLKYFERLEFESIRFDRGSWAHPSRVRVSSSSSSRVSSSTRTTVTRTRNSNSQNSSFAKLDSHDVPAVSKIAHRCTNHRTLFHSAQMAHKQ